MAWRKLQIEWTEAAQAELATLVSLDRDDLVECIRVLVKLYATRGLGDSIEELGGEWRGRGRLKPQRGVVCEGWRVVFKPKPLKQAIRIEHIAPREVVYLAPPRALR
jgi:hypothetical protein